MKGLVPVIAVFAAGAVFALVVTGGAEPLDFVVTTDVDLGLDPSDQFVHSFSTGVWRATTDGETVTISEEHLFGDEGGEATEIELSLTGPVPEVLGVRWSSSDAYSGEDAADHRSGSLQVQVYEPGRLIAGVLTPLDSQPIPFWVDLREGGVVEPPPLGEAFTLPPGGVAVMNDWTVVRFAEVVEDSRCPEDVTCVWEGAVAVEVVVTEDGQATTAVLRGFSNPEGGTSFGDSPSIDLVSGRLTLSLVGLDEAGATFVSKVVGD